METKDTYFCEESFIDRSFLVLEILREDYPSKGNRVNRVNRVISDAINNIYYG